MSRFWVALKAVGKLDLKVVGIFGRPESYGLQECQLSLLTGLWLP